jgi:hypothetical protein
MDLPCLCTAGVGSRHVPRLLSHARVSTTDTYLKASEQVTRHELRAFHRKSGRVDSSFTQSQKSNPPGASKAATARAGRP